MTPPPTETDPSPKPRRSALVALGWGFACAACACSCWIFVYTLLAHYDMPPNPILRRLLADAAGKTAMTAAVSGLVFGTIIGLASTNRGAAVLVLGFGGAFVGALGGGITLPVMILLRGWLEPPVSVALLWYLVGFFAGVGAHCCSDKGTGASEHGRSIRARLAHMIFLFSLLGFVLLQLFVIATTRY